MAADSTAVRAGRAFVEIFADDSALARGLKSASKKLKAWGAGLTAAGTKAALIGTAMISPFVAATKAFSDAGSQLVDMSQRTGVSVEALGGLKYAAEQSGASIEDLEGGFKNMQTALHDAASGVDTARKKFEALHLSVKELKNLPPDQAFIKIAEAVSKIQNPSKQAAVSLDLLGKKGMMLLPLMKAGAAGIKVMTDEAARLGITMSTEDAMAAEAFGDKTAKAMTQIKTAFVRMGAAILPILEPVIDKISDVLKVTAEWINKNRGLVVLALSAGVALLAFSYAITAVGVAISVAGSVIGWTVTGFTLLGTALAAVSTLANPVGIALVVLLGVMTGLANWSKVAADSMEWLGSIFGPLKDEAVSTMSAIGNAIAAGNIQAAVKVLWAFLNLQWQKGTASLLSAWYNFTLPAVLAWNTAVYKMADIAVDAFWSIQSAFGALSDFIAKSSGSAAFAFTRTWIGALAAVGAASIKFRSLFDKNVNVAGEMLALGQQVGEMMQQAIGQNDSTQAGIDQKSKQRKAAIEAAQSASKVGIEAARQQSEDNTKAAREKALNDAERGLAAAREEWKSTVSETGKSGLDKLKNAGPGIMDQLGGAGGGGVSGTFNSFGVRGLSTGGGLQVLVTKISELTSEVKGARREINDAPVLSPAG